MTEKKTNYFPATISGEGPGASITHIPEKPASLSHSLNCAIVKVFPSVLFTSIFAANIRGKTSFLHFRDLWTRERSSRVFPCGTCTKCTCSCLCTWIAHRKYLGYHFLKKFSTMIFFDHPEWFTSLCDIGQVTPRLPETIHMLY